MSAIDDKYAELGGAGGFLGQPLEPEMPTPDGLGSYRHYQFGSIYYKLATGAHEVHGAIREKWKILNWEAGPLGYPVTDELDTPSDTTGRVGRFNHFEKGSIYWRPGADAYQVHVDIREKWAMLDWEQGFLGYPVTDELFTPPDDLGRVGRFNRFEGGMIYWTPDNQAYEMHGEILALWSSLGFEQSELGFPTSDEMDTPHGTGRVSHFERGSIYWDARRHAYEVFPRPDYPPCDPAAAGRWEIPAFKSGVVGMHAALLHTNKVLFFAYREPHDPHDPDPEPPPFGESATLDLSTHTTSVPAYRGASGPEMINIFCSGHALLPDGRLLVAGGDRELQERIRSLHVFSPNDAGGESWQYLEQFASGRWYPSCVTLPDGRVLIAGGEKRIDGPDNPNTSYQIFNPASGRLEPEVNAPALLAFGKAISYPFVFVLPNRKLFMHGGTRTVFLDLASWLFDPVPLEAADRPGRNVRTYGLEGTGVLLPLLPQSSPPYHARVMLIGGGGGDPVMICTPATNTCELLDTAAPNPGWQLAAPMSRPRVMPDAVLLPDGNVLVMNGSSSGYADNGANPVWEAELYNPAANTWTTLCAMQVPRLYHATALLLPDGRVMTAGTDSLWNPDPFHHAELRVELFEPPYLFGGPRPVIAGAPATIAYGAPFAVDTPDATVITAAALLRCGSCTHSFNPDQRYVGLVITARDAGSVTVLAPPDGFVAPPGYYMLFILREGIPSVARFMRLVV